MPGRLQEELKQRRPFELPEEALLNVVRTADALHQRVAQVLKPFGLTEAQYNALRILRGAGEEGRTCKEISDRMIKRDPDVTRMLDRLVTRKLVRRERDSSDRRVVRSHITTDGKALLHRADPAIRNMHKELTEAVNPASLRSLIETQEALRQ